MQKISTLLLFTFLFFCKTFAQTNPSDKQIMDSLIQNDDFFKMMSNSNNSLSYFKVNLGIGNKLYNADNTAIQSLQSNNSLVFSPALGYYNKSGFGVSFTGYLFNENSKTAFYQYAISPSYEYASGKSVNTSFSYTHYFVKDVYTVHTSPVQNDFYGAFNLKKMWLKPGLSADYSTGLSHEVVKIDTTIKVQNQNVRIKYTDTAAIHLSSFSFAATMEHEFDFSDLFSKKDGFSFIPQLSLITGINRYQVNHKSTQSNYNTYTKKRIKSIKHFQSQSGNNKYELQSIGLDLYGTYSIGKFFVEPEVYLDYYLPKTSDNRFSQVFSLNIGMTF